MIRGIVCCALGVLTFGIGLKHFWDLNKGEPVQEKTPAAPAPKDEVIDTTAVAE